MDRNLIEILQSIDEDLAILRQDVDCLLDSAKHLNDWILELQTRIKRLELSEPQSRGHAAPLFHSWWEIEPAKETLQNIENEQKEG